MNRFIIILACWCIEILMISCSEETSIYGKIEQEGIKELHLYTFNQGDIHEFSSVQVTPEETFLFTFQLPYEGMYLLGENERVLFPVYLKKGERVNLNFTRERLSPIGQQSSENQALFRWEEKAADVRLHSVLYDHIPGGKSVTYSKFFQELTALSTFQKEFLASLSKKEGTFYSLLKNKVEASFKALSEK